MKQNASSKKLVADWKDRRLTTKQKLKNRDEICSSFKLRVPLSKALGRPRPRHSLEPRPLGLLARLKLVRQNSRLRLPAFRL